MIVINEQNSNSFIKAQCSSENCLIDDVNALDYLGEKLQNFSYTPTIQLAPIWLGSSLEMATVPWPGIADPL